MGTILITGGLGYIGGRLIQYLNAQPNAPTLRLMTRRAPTHVPSWAKDLNIVRGDIFDQTALNMAVEGVETVIHLTAANEIESIQNPEEATAVTGVGTYKLLTASRMAGVRRFIYFSTFHVYGAQLQGTITERTLPRPVHPYAITHRLAEDFVNWHRDVVGMNTVIFRLSNGYGCPADPAVNRWTLVFNDLCRQAIRDQKLVLKSSGRQRRDFVSLHNVARAVQHVLCLPTERWGDGLYNLGGSCCLSILDVAQRIAGAYEKYFGRPLVIHVPEIHEISEPSQFTYSTKKLEETGFALLENMDEEIQRTFTLCARRDFLPE